MYRSNDGTDGFYLTLCKTLKQIPPEVLQHINLYGRYEFKKFSEPINMDDIVQQLTQV